MAYLQASFSKNMGHSFTVYLKRIGTMGQNDYITIGVYVKLCGIIETMAILQAMAVLQML
jgi:hypothetical protein